MSIDILYPWIKSIHIISVICWLAAMLYLPRLFVYHCSVRQKSSEDQLLILMERRLSKYIMLPAMTGAWITGLWLAIYIYHFQGGWLHLKLLLVLALSAFHGFLTASLRRFANGKNKYSSKTWRIFNEVPTVLMIIIVCVVVLKPFG